MTLTLRFAARSDRGLIRDGNQDSVYAGPRLLAVADGMGGMAAGDVASNIVIAGIAPLDEDVPGNDLVDSLRRAVDGANQQLRNTVEANPAMEGMGTTLTALLFTGSRFGLVHVGDSRGYLLREGEFNRITKDDTYVQMLVDEGRITEEEASTHHQRSLLTKALDGRDVEPDFSVREARVGDRYLICSDGLSGVVSGETIGDTLREYADPQQCVERLIELALRGGGPDNVTVIVADVTDEDIVEGVPLVGGAAARDRGQTTNPPDLTTSAGRAAALATAPRPAAPVPEPVAEDDEAPRRRRPVRAILITLLVLALLGVGVWGLWTSNRAQFYVGATDKGTVGVFQGYPGEILGMRLSTVVVTGERKIDDLAEPAADRVRKGIPGKGDDAQGRRSDAEKIYRSITDDSPTNSNLLPLCGDAVPTPTGSPSGTPGTTPSASASASAGATPSGSTSPHPTGSVSSSATPSGSASPSPGTAPAKCRRA